MIINDETIIRENLTIVDSQGNCRIMLSATDDLPNISLFDNDGSDRIRIGLDTGGNAHVCCRDASGMPRVGMQVKANGSGIHICDSKGGVCINVSVIEPHEMPIICIFDKNHQPIFQYGPNARCPCPEDSFRHDSSEPEI